MADNAGKPSFDLRIRKLKILSPSAFLGGVQRVLFTDNVDLNATQCGENGYGSLNWLLRINRPGGVITTGGAPPSADPFGKGYCFYRHRTRDGIDVVPGSAHVNFAGDTFTSERIPKLHVPIFLKADKKNVITLPLSDVVVHKTTLSEAGNCIGSFNQTALDGECSEDPSACVKWKTNASLGAYITLEEADVVKLTDANQSLCALLTGTTGPDGKCPRDANGKLALSEAERGDYCSTSKQPGDCGDSFWFAATFAASAVKIHDGAGVTECAP